MQIRQTGPAVAGSIAIPIRRQSPASIRCRSCAAGRQAHLPRSAPLVGATRLVAPLALQPLSQPARSRSKQLVVAAQKQACSPLPSAAYTCALHGGEGFAAYDRAVMIA